VGHQHRPTPDNVADLAARFSDFRRDRRPSDIDVRQGVLFLMEWDNEQDRAIDVLGRDVLALRPVNESLRVQHAEVASLQRQPSGPRMPRGSKKTKGRRHGTGV
jgi:hypothetical protein